MHGVKTGAVRHIAMLLSSRVICVAVCMLAVTATATAGTPRAARHVQASVTAVNLSGSPAGAAAVTFGEPFRAGDIPAGNTIVAFMDGKPLPTQANIKARNPDGSVRHAILTVRLPRIAGNATMPLRLRPKAETTATSRDLTLADVLKSGFKASVDLDIAGRHWHLDARPLLKHAAASHACKPYGGRCNHWLSGPLASAWVVGGPVRNSQGARQPHIAVYFAVRAYGPAPVQRVRVDVVVENDWAYVPDPHNITYNAAIKVGGHTVYSVDHLTHYRQTRWHKAFWWGTPHHIYVRQNPAYLQASMAVPRYQDVPASDAWLAKQPQSCAPMHHCDQTKNMSTQGAQAGIGPLPQWTTAYVIHPTYHAYRWMLADNDALGSYPVHYRDHTTGKWITFQAHPCATMIWHKPPKRCPVAPHGNDRFPECPKHADCHVPWVTNIAHVPAAAYVAYMVTGDWYYLTEMTSWADMELLHQNQSYRGYARGYIHRLPLRAQAWALRTLGDTAYILPDNDPLKHYFNRIVARNVAWYNQHYTDNPGANQLHIITNGSLVYPNGNHRWTGMAVWQASFFTWSVGNLKDLGFAGAGKLLDWVGAFQVNLMTSPDFCWTQATTYQLQVRDSRESPIYTSIAELYRKNFPELQGVKCNSPAMWTFFDKNTSGHYKYAKDQMVGYPGSPTGFPANFQIGLAAAADANIPNARKAWGIFVHRARHPDYSQEPQFAVIPRHWDKAH